MKTKTVSKPHKAVHRHNQQSAVLGLVFDLWRIGKFVLRALAFVVHILSWPVRSIMPALHNLVKHHPSLRSPHAFRAVSVAIGVSIITVAFSIQPLMEHTLWHVFCETMKAAGVVPVWELVALGLRAGARG